MLRLDLTKVQDKGFEALPAGIYSVEVVEAKQAVSSNSKPYINLHMSVVGEHFANRRVFDKLFLTDASLWKVKNFLKAVGFSPLELDSPDFALNSTEEGVFTELAGLQCAAQLKVTNYTDKNGEAQEQNEVVTYIANKPAAG